GTHVLHEVAGEVEDVGPPLGFGGQPPTQRLGERRQVQEQMLGLDELRRLAVDARTRITQIGGVELVAAVVALVPASTVVTADGAGPLDVPVGQRASRGRADGARGGHGDDVTVAVQGQEDLLDHLGVVAGTGPGEQVVRHPEPLQVLGDLAGVLVGRLLRGQALLLGLDLDRGAVFVGTRHHEHLVTGHSLVAGENVGRNAETGYMADVAGAVGVRPGHRGQHRSAHGYSAYGFRHTNLARGRIGPHLGRNVGSNGRNTAHRGTTPDPRRPKADTDHGPRNEVDLNGRFGKPIPGASGRPAEDIATPISDPDVSRGPIGYARDTRCTASTATPSSTNRDRPTTTDAGIRRTPPDTRRPTPPPRRTSTARRASPPNAARCPGDARRGAATATDPTRCGNRPTAPPRGRPAPGRRHPGGDSNRIPSSTRTHGPRAARPNPPSRGTPHRSDRW